jgi:hypothetical protein
MEVTPRSLRITRAELLVKPEQQAHFRDSKGAFQPGDIHEEDSAGISSGIGCSLGRDRSIASRNRDHQEW